MFQDRHTFFLYLGCVASHFTFCVSVYPRRDPSASPRIHALCLQSRRVLLLCPRTSASIMPCIYAPTASVASRSFTVPPQLTLYHTAYLYCASAPEPLSRRVPPHWYFCFATYPRNFSVYHLRSSAPELPLCYVRPHFHSEWSAYL